MSVIRFNWREANGDITNWWGVERHQFVHTEWGQFAVAVDLRRREAQIAFNHPPEWLTFKFKDIPGDSNVQLAFEAVVETGEHAAFATELFLRAIGRDDLADKITKDGLPRKPEMTADEA